ncbi:Zn-dependent hydrolase [Virgibacillus sp. W0430]|uniref:Zn-dependent hydrolase n=1 Tax=Virgibacillus sp. W0430 TaxID=3391580 RepID=UPI003F44857E
MSIGSKIKINKERLWNSINELGDIGSMGEQGVTRLSLTKEDMEARSYIIDLMETAGLQVRIDAIGNIIGKIEGKDPTAPVVMTGSHIDTVFNGGKFDGALGVLAGIEAARTIIENQVPIENGIEIISFTDEEGARFNTGFIGSKALTGYLTEEELAKKDRDGVRMDEALMRAGFTPDTCHLARRSSNEIKAYLELHIEQGRVLETENLPIGIVTDIQGTVWIDVAFIGRADHAGATPMSIRVDASLAMSESLPLIEKAAIKWGGVATVGTMQFYPGGINIIPEKVMFTIDCRHVDKTKREQMKNEIIGLLHQCAEKRSLKAKVKVNVEVDPASCSTKIIKVFENVVTQTGLPLFKMKCGAGHDALFMSKITDFGMILVRSKDGISHNPNEWSSKEDCSIGTQVLYEALVLLSK